MTNLNVYNQAGQVVSEIELNEAVFGIEPKTQAMFDAVIAYRAALRQGTHSTKTRAEVRGGGRKPWKQKGTGRARQGSIRSPQWRGGGVVFGPTPRNYTLKVNKKVRRLAIKSALSTVVANNGLMVIDAINFETPKTKEFKAMLTALNTGKKTLVVVTEGNDNVFFAGRNLPNVTIVDNTQLNIVDVLHNDTLLVTTDALKAIEEVLA